jgi:hypothetical protein
MYVVSFGLVDSGLRKQQPTSITSGATVEAATPEDYLPGSPAWTAPYTSI